MHLSTFFKLSNHPMQIRKPDDEIISQTTIREKETLLRKYGLVIE